MKKTLLFLFALLGLGVSGAWAEVTVTWESYNGWQRNAVASAIWVGITTPGSQSDTYKMSDFQFAQETGDGATTCYTAIATTAPSGKGSTLNENNVLAVSTNSVQATETTYYTYNLASEIELTGGTTYYMVFISSNTPADGKYEVTTQRVSLNTSYGTYTPGLLAGNGTSQSTWTPGFKATLTTDAVYKVTYTSYSTVDASEIGSGTFEDVVGTIKAPTVAGYVFDHATDASDNSFDLSKDISKDISLKFYYRPILTALANASSTKAYTFKTIRGYLYAASDDATSISAATGNPTASNKLHQWAVVPYNGKNYLYNVGAGKFASATSSNSNQLLELSNVNITSTSTSSNDYPVMLKINSDATLTVNIDGNPNVLINSWNTSDDGNNFQIEEAEDFSAEDLATAQAKLEQYDKYLQLSAIDYGTGLGQYVFGGTLADYAGNEATFINSLSSGYSADKLTQATTMLDETVIRQPSGRFARFYSPTTKNYIGTAASGQAPMVEVAEAGIYYITADNKIVSYDQGLYLSSNAGAQVAAAGNEGTVFTFADATSNKFSGKYSLYYGGSGYLISWTDGKTNRWSSVIERAEWTIEAVEDIPVTFKGEYASFYSPVDLTIPEEGVEVYTGTLNDAKTVLTLNKVEGKLPANTGVILKKTGEESTVNFTVLSTVTPGTSALTGTVAAKAAVDDGVLVLGKSNDVWGIYNYEGTLGGFKAYMDKETAGDVKGFAFNFGDADAIEEIVNGKSSNGKWYNLAGQRVEKATRGLYIVNGKKVVIK